MKKKIVLFLIGCLFMLGIGISTNAETEVIYAAVVDTQGSRLNVRKSDSIHSEIIGKINDRTYLTLGTLSNDFYGCEYLENTYGYVHKDYVQILSDDVRIVDTDGARLNVRTGPSVQNPIFEKISDQDRVVVLSTNKNFAKVLFEGNKVGYVCTDYLTSSATNSLCLNLVSYQQKDPRWASVTIGNSTIAKIGCLTTCLAMSESFRTQNTYTPLTIRNTYSYTPDGSLYWKSHYHFYFAKDFLAKAYELLKQNKPVLIGLKTSSQGQHWVVIKGYKNRGILNPENFIISDPASDKSDLQQVFNEYPLFYKLAYYE